MIERSSVTDAVVLHRPGKQSVQIVWPESSSDARATITRVTMAPGSVSPRHNHPTSEQIWIVEQGEAVLLLDDSRTEKVAAGDVIRTPAGDIHGIENTGQAPFAYLAVTCPPENMSGFYGPGSKKPTNG